MAHPMSVSDSCPPVHFLAELFTPTQNGTMASYHQASDQAHIVLGILLLCMVFAWAGFVLDFYRVRAASRWSGVFQTLMGVYLFTWVFYLMLPGKTEALWEYATKDLLQLQHIAIASLLCAGGLIELLQSSWLLPPMSTTHAVLNSLTPVSPVRSLAASRSGSCWHVLWSTNLMLTGLVFMLHPQHTYNATIKHLLLGTSLILGAPLFIRAKMLAWKSELDLLRKQSAIDSADSNSFATKGNHVDWSMIVAGGSFALAASILLAFREQPTELHVGTTRECQPSFLICILSYCCAGGSALIASIVAANHRYHHRSHTRGDICTSCCRSRRWTALPANGDDEADGRHNHRRSEMEIEIEMEPHERDAERKKRMRREDNDDTATSRSNAALRASYGFSSLPPSTSSSGSSDSHSPPNSFDHTLGDLTEYESDEAEEEVDELGDEDDIGEEQEEQRRDREVERRRQEEYTGEEN